MKEAHNQYHNLMNLNTETPYKIYGDSIEQGAIEQFEKCLNMEGCIQGALMPDSHLGYTAPIGSILKFKNKISLLFQFVHQL